MDDQLKQLFRMAVGKYIADRELLRGMMSQGPLDSFARIMWRTMPPVAPCSEFALRMRVKGSQQRQGRG